MKSSKRRRFGSVRQALPALAVAATLAATALAAPQPQRVVAIGDIHGAHTELVEILRRSGIVDAEGAWAAGDGVLVQTGDFTDRGAGVRAVIDLLMRLQEEAAAAGGRVLVLLGNHEAMNLMAEYRDVGPEAYAAFVDADSERRRQQAFKEWKKHVRRRFAALERGVPSFSAAVRDTWMAAHPPGYLEYHAALRLDGRYGAWLRGLPVVVRAGDSLFLHGGLSPGLAEADLEALNRDAQAEVAGFDRLRDELLEAGLILPTDALGDIFVAVSDALAAAEAQGHAAAAAGLAAQRAELQRLLGDGLLFGVDGPLWYRGYANLENGELAPLIERTLAAQEVERVVVGHTPSEAARIVTRLDGRVFLIDTGMQRLVHPLGRAAALAVAGGEAQPLYLEDPAEVAAPAGGLLPLDRAQVLADGGLPQVEEEEKGRTWVGAEGQPLPFSGDDEVLEFLRSARIVEITPIGRGVTNPDRLLLERGGVRAHAIFHDIDITEQQARFRGGGGVVRDFRDRYVNNVAAYELARLLGLDNVPPAVLREVDGRRGSVGMWIENAFDEGDRQARGLQAPDRTAWLRRFFDMRIFDNLIHNIDRNQGNIVYEQDWTFWMVDHTRAFGTSPRLPADQHVVRCSRELLAALRGLERDSLQERLTPFLSKVEVRALLKRRDRIVERLEAQIAARGEASVLFSHGDAGGEDEPETGLDVPPADDAR